jgi:uncharacterized protein (TIGR03437 family)
MALTILPARLRWCLFSVLLSAHAQPYVISTFAGFPSLPSSGPAVAASFVSPTGVVTDSSGNFYFISLGCIFKVNSEGLLTRIAGDGTTGFSGDGGTALNAQFNQPQALAVDTSGNVYVADTSNNRIRKISPAGLITTAATNLSFPYGVAVDKSGNLFVPDSLQHRIVRVSPTGVTTTVAQIGSPSGLALDAAGNLYVVDSNRIQRISPDGAVSTLAGGGTADPGPDGVLATQVVLASPSGVAVDNNGNCYISETARVRKVSSSGIITTVAGGISQGFTPDGGAATKALFSGVSSVAVDTTGNVLFTDRYNNRVRKVFANGILTTVASDGFAGPAGDGGPASAAQFQGASNVVFDSAGNLFIADTGRNRIRKVAPNGVITTFAGDSAATSPGDGGPATRARLLSPLGLASGADGNLYISDVSRVRQVDPNGIISTLAGGDYAGYFGDGVPATSAIFAFVYSLAFDSKGNLYLADHDNNRVRKVDRAGIVTTVAGNGMWAYCGDGGPATDAGVENPTAVTTDAAGNLYIAAGGGVRMVTRAGIITSVVPYGAGGDALCVPSNTRINYLAPSGLAIDRAGNLYVSEYNTIRKRSSNGTITTIAGTGVSGYSGDGGPATRAQISSSGLTIDATGNVFFAASDRVRVLRPQTPNPLSVTNAATNLAGPIAPGEIVVVYGSALGPSQLTTFRVNSSGAMSTDLAGTTVTFNGTPASILYTSATQVSAIVPYAISGNTADVAVTFQNGVSATSVGIAASAPGLFTSDSTGKGQAAAFNQDGSLNGSAVPAKAGDAIVLYATGEGLTTPAGTDGKLASTPAPAPNLPVTVQIAGQTAHVIYAAGAPGQVAGMMQINAEIPGGIAPGDAVPVVLQVGTATSPPGVTITAR